MGRKTYLVDETVRRAVYKGLARSRRRAFERHFFATRGRRNIKKTVTRHAPRAALRFRSVDQSSARST